MAGSQPVTTRSQSPSAALTNELGLSLGESNIRPSKREAFAI